MIATMPEDRYRGVGFSAALASSYDTISSTISTF